MHHLRPGPAVGRHDHRQVAARCARPGNTTPARSSFRPTFRKLHDRVDHRSLRRCWPGVVPLAPSTSTAVARGPGQDMLRDMTTLTGPSPDGARDATDVGQLRRARPPSTSDQASTTSGSSDAAENDRPPGAGHLPDLQAGRGDQLIADLQPPVLSPSAGIAHNSSPRSSQAGTPAGQSTQAASLASRTVEVRAVSALTGQVDGQHGARPCGRAARPAGGARPSGSSARPPGRGTVQSSQQTWRRRPPRGDASRCQRLTSASSLPAAG